MSWNTLYLDRVVSYLQQQGAEVRDGDLARVSPLMHAHIRALGRYHFRLHEAVAEGRPGPGPKESAATCAVPDLSPLCDDYNARFSTGVSAPMLLMVHTAARRPRRARKPANGVSALASIPPVGVPDRLAPPKLPNRVRRRQPVAQVYSS